MENTYWNKKGKFPHEQVSKLNALIPVEGPAKGRGNKALEQFRQASNLYYEIYNNGCYNTTAGAKKFFGIEGKRLRSLCRDRWWHAIEKYTEPGMDRVIALALIEQKIFS
jgi:hypothetical protein